MHFAGLRRRHNLIFLGAAAIIALTGTNAFSNPSHKPVVSHQNKALKGETGKPRLAMNASHRNRAIKAESPKQIAASSRRNKKAKADKRKHKSPAEANHAERAPGPRVILSSEPMNVGNSTAAPELAPDLAALKQAIRLVQQHKFDEASTLTASIDDPVAQKVIEWAYLRDPESRAGFDRYNAFLQNNPAWSSTLLRRRAEARLWQERRDAATVRRFIGEQPVSTQGRLATARVLLDTDRLGAAHRVRAIWQSAELSAELEAAIANAFPGVLTADDDVARMDRRIGAKDIAAAMKVAKRLGSTTSQS